MSTNQAQDGTYDPPTDAGGELVIIGAGETAQVAYQYFTFDSPYEVVAFSIESSYIDQDELSGVPVVPVEELPSTHPPSSHSAFVAISFTNLNRLRTELYGAVKQMGYSLASYVSSNAFVWHNVSIGENCFIFEDNVIQHECEIGDNVVLWSGNHIGHQTSIADNCFITSHVVISGLCDIGENSFLGVNTSVADDTTVGHDCVVGAGTVVHSDLDGGQVYVGNPARSLDKSSYESMGIEAPDG
jgi:sugar O-acyltransferase (sialic acid O-acetyltransferase NeuD family)